MFSLLVITLNLPRKLGQSKMYSKTGKYLELTHFVKTTSGNKTDEWLSIVTSNRCDICSVGPNSIASVWIFILLVFSFLRIESKWSSNHVNSVRLQLGNWPINVVNSWICAVCDATVPVAISSKRGNKSVVNSGSGNSLQIIIYLIRESMNTEKAKAKIQK